MLQGVLEEVAPRVGRLDQNAALLLSVRLSREVQQRESARHGKHCANKPTKENIHISVCHIPHYVLFEIISIQYKHSCSHGEAKPT